MHPNSLVLLAKFALDDDYGIPDYAFDQLGVVFEQAGYSDLFEEIRKRASCYEDRATIDNGDVLNDLIVTV
ncbi:MAG: hypothetical protein EBU90_27400 [Proteobacteria bacterium]|nr:hypothetical protein [Pseudomonadota bacterium]